MSSSAGPGTSIIGTMYFLHLLIGPDLLNPLHLSGSCPEIECNSYSQGQCLPEIPSYCDFELLEGGPTNVNGSKLRVTAEDRAGPSDHRNAR